MRKAIIALATVVAGTMAVDVAAAPEPFVWKLKTVHYKHLMSVDNNFSEVPYCDKLSACDMYFVASVGGREICRGSVIKDDDRPAWALRLDQCNFTDGSTVVFDFWDEDVTRDDFISACHVRLDSKGSRDVCWGTFMKAELEFRVNPFDEEVRRRYQ